MGKVYSPEEVYWEQVPCSATAHLNAKAQLLQALAEFQSERVESNQGTLTFDGALVYGSVAYGHPSFRSDLDVLIACYSTDPLPRFRTIFDAVTATTQVPIEPNVWEISDLELGTHTMDQSFVSVLKSTPEEDNLVGNNPAASIKATQITLAELFSYLAAKKNSFAKSYLQPGQESTYRPLQRAFELPVALGRKVLTVLHATGFITDLPPPSAHPDILAGISAIYEVDAAAHCLFRVLRERDEQYSDLLRSAINGEITVAKYAAELRSFQPDSIYKALQLAVRTQDVIMELTSPDKVETGPPLPAY